MVDKAVECNNLDFLINIRIVTLINSTVIYNSPQTHPKPEEIFNATVICNSPQTRLKPLYIPLLNILKLYYIVYISSEQLKSTNLILLFNKKNKKKNERIWSQNDILVTELKFDLGPVQALHLGLD